MIYFSGSSFYEESEIPRKFDIVENSPDSLNFKINFSSLSDNESPEWVFIYFGISNNSNSANSHGWKQRLR